MSNVLSEEQKQQVIALGRLGWSLRRIQRETGIRRETISAYLKEAGVELRPPRGRRIRAKPASRASEVTPDSAPPKPASEAEEVTTDSGEESTGQIPPQPEPKPGRSPSASACEPYAEMIEVGRSRGRNAKAIWQDLVDAHGFAGGYQSVKRFIRKFRGKTSRRKPARSSRLRPARSFRSTMALAPWSAMRPAANTGAHGYSC